MSDDARHLRKEFLKDADKIVNRVKKAYTERNGESILTNQEEAVLKQVWPTLEKVILSVEDVKLVEANNVSQILSLVSKGKLTITEAKEWIGLLKDAEELEDMKKNKVSTTQLTNLILGIERDKKLRELKDE